MAKTTPITAEVVRAMFKYNPDNGELRRKIGPRKDCVVGWIEPHGYLRVKIGGKKVYCHRIAFLHYHGRIHDGRIDHVNGDRSDNRIANLREVDDFQNAANCGLKRNNTSGASGVAWSKRENKWKASIRSGGKMFNLGTFSDFDAACAARAHAERRLNGEFARKQE